MKQLEMLKKHRYILEKLATSNLKNRKIILRHSPSELFKVLGVVFDLIVNRKLDLNDKQFKALKKHRRVIKSTSALKGADLKPKLTAQRDGALATILSTVVPILDVIFQSFI